MGSHFCFFSGGPIEELEDAGTAFDGGVPGAVGHVPPGRADTTPGGKLRQHEAPCDLEVLWVVVGWWRDRDGIRGVACQAGAVAEGLR